METIIAGRGHGKTDKMDKMKKRWRDRANALEIRPEMRNGEAYCTTWDCPAHGINGDSVCSAWIEENFATGNLNAVQMITHSVCLPWYQREVKYLRELLKKKDDVASDRG